MAEGMQLWQSDSTDSVESSDFCDAVRAAVETELTSKQREVVEAHFFEGLSQGEIARRLGITQQVVHKRLHGVRRGEHLVGGALPRLRHILAPLMPR
jgi:RNA polymerase sigma factor (sigma-70 family)